MLSRNVTRSGIVRGTPISSQRKVDLVNDWTFENMRTIGRCTNSAGAQKVGRNTAIINIVRPKPGQLRARKVVSRARVRPTGKYPSWKIRRMVQWESENELNPFDFSIAIRMLPVFVNSHAKSFTFSMASSGAIIQTSLSRETVEKNFGR
jgi:hypothetical protein